MDGAMSLHMMPCIVQRFPSLASRLRGIFIMSSYLIKSSYFMRSPRVYLDVPILMLHGLSDSMILYEWGLDTSTDLQSIGYNLTFKSYPHTGHEISQDMVSANCILYNSYTPSNSKLLFNS